MKKVNVRKVNVRRDIEKYIDASLKVNHFSGSILIAKGDRCLLKKGYGLANYELGVRCVPSTKYRINSMTKQFTAMAIMQLYNKGLLQLEDSVKKYIPGYPHGQNITIHHLLTHTSGIPDFPRLPEYAKKKMFPSVIEKTIGMFKNKPLEFKPGKAFKYSSSGYILLSYIIEKISKNTYLEFLHKNIFQPLNMLNTCYDNQRAIIENRAAGYTLGENTILANVPYFDRSISSGAGGLLSTVEDMYYWDRALYTEKLVCKSTMNKIFTPYINNYGYGWSIEEVFNCRRINHSGRGYGFCGNISRYVDLDICIVVLSNYDYASISQISRDLFAIVYGKNYEFPKPRKVTIIDRHIWEEHTGHYSSRSEPLSITITSKANHLYSQMTNQPKIEIYPESKMKYFAKTTDMQITFLRNKKGAVTELIYHIWGLDLRLKKSSEEIGDETKSGLFCVSPVRVL